MNITRSKINRSVEQYKANNDAYFWVILLALLVINAFNIVRVEFLPFNDVPNHLAEAEIYGQYLNNELFRKYYSLNVSFYPNTFHLFFFNLPVFKDVEVGNKVLHLMLVVSLPILVYLIIKKLNGNTWYSLLSFFYVYNFNLNTGFTGNTLAINLILVLVLFWIDYVQKPSIWREIMISGILILIFFAHAMMTIFSILLLLSFIVYRAYIDSQKRIPGAIIMVLPTTVLIIHWWLSKEGQNESTILYLFNYYTSDFFIYYWRRFGLFALDNYHLISGFSGIVLTSIFSVLAIIPLFFAKNIKQFIVRNMNTIKAYAFLFLLLSLICYFLAPYKIPGQIPIYTRFSTILFLSMIVFIGLLNPLLNIAYRYLVILAVILHSFLWWDYFSQFEKETAEFDSAVLPENPAATLTFVPLDIEFRDRPIFIHFQNYYIVRKGGIATTKIIDYRFGMIRRNENGDLPMQVDNMRQLEKHQGILKEVDYLLVKGKLKNLPSYLKEANIQVVKSQGSWHLLKNN